MPNALSTRPRSRKEPQVAAVAYPADGSRVDLQSASRLILLIHGYNNSEAAAREAFAHFRRNVRTALPREQIWDFHWPGSHPDQVMSSITYPVRVALAPQVGAALAKFLDEECRHVRSISIVAHSLGCRVALETTFSIAQRPGYLGPRLEHVVLMAAAVPVTSCGSSGQFSSAVMSSREHVFYSPRDIVLAAGFPKFQAAVGPFEEGEAVGYTGQPAGRWSSRTGVCLKHGKYWRSQRVSKDIVHTLDTGMPTPSLPERCLHSYSVRAAAATLQRVHLPRRYLPWR